MSPCSVSAAAQLTPQQTAPVPTQAGAAGIASNERNPFKRAQFTVVERLRLMVLPAGPVVVDPPSHLPPEHVVFPERVAVWPRGPVTVVFDEHEPPLHDADPSLVTVLPAGPVVVVERWTWALAAPIMARAAKPAIKTPALRRAMVVM